MSRSTSPSTNGISTWCFAISAIRTRLHGVRDDARAGGGQRRAWLRILFGEDFVHDNTVLTSLINANSPLVWDSTMRGAAEVYARANQACIITPFILWER